MCPTASIAIPHGEDARWHAEPKQERKQVDEKRVVERPLDESPSGYDNSGWDCADDAQRPQLAAEGEILHQRYLRKATRAPEDLASEEDGLIPVRKPRIARAEIRQVQEGAPPGSRPGSISDRPGPKGAGSSARVRKRASDVFGGVSRKGDVGVEKKQHVSSRASRAYVHLAGSPARSLDAASFSTGITTEMRDARLSESSSLMAMFPTATSWDARAR